MTDDDIMNAMSSVVLTDDTTETTQQEADTATTSSTNNYQIQLEKGKFTTLSGALTLLQDICNDCDIHEGVVRCRTNNHKNMIVMDLSSIIGDKSIIFSGLKNKLKQLNTFNFVSDGSTNTNILIESNDSKFEFSDSISIISIMRPIASYLENTYITDEEFATINSTMNREDAVLFNVTINGFEKKRISNLCDIYCSDTVTFEFNGSTATYFTQTSSKDNVSKACQNIALNRELSQKKTLINNLAFKMDTPGDLQITCYMIGEEFCMIKSVIHYFDIPITIYTKSRIIDINNDN